MVAPAKADARVLMIVIPIWMVASRVSGLLCSSMRMEAFLSFFAISCLIRLLRTEIIAISLAAKNPLRIMRNKTKSSSSQVGMFMNCLKSFLFYCG